MKYDKGTFTTVPNIELLSGLDPQTQCLFMWLCHYANKDGKCFPSIKRLSENTGISYNVIKQRTDYLINLGLLEREKRISNNSQTTNLYKVLIKDKINQCESPKTRKSQHSKSSPHDGGTSAHGGGGGHEVGTELNLLLTKTTDTNVSVADTSDETDPIGSPQGFGEELPKNTSRDLDKPEDLLSERIQEILALFYTINPSLNFANNTFRSAAEWMIKKSETNGGYDYLLKLTKAVISCQGKDFAPVATNPYEMKEKLLKFKMYFERENKPKPKIYEV